MYAQLFKNWKFALLWAVGLTGMAAAFIERGAGPAQVPQPAQQASTPSQPITTPRPEPTPVPKAQDEAGIDDSSAASAPDGDAPVDQPEAPTYQNDAPVSQGEVADSPA